MANALKALKVVGYFVAGWFAVDAATWMLRNI